jgi:hypothetical protein
MPISLPVAGVRKNIRVLIGVLLAALPAFAEGGSPIVLVADSRRFSGGKAWWANVYNESHLWFALVTIVTIPVLGLLIGKFTSWILARIGINLKSRVVVEH